MFPKKLEVKEEKSVGLLAGLVNRLVMSIVSSPNDLHDSAVRFEGQESFVRVEVVDDEIQETIDGDANS